MTLTAEQLAEFRDALTRRRSELVAEMRTKLAEASGERIAPDTATTTAGGDEALLATASSMDLAVVKRDAGELREIEAAQQRLDEGAYGECIECGEPIAIERLRVYAAARRCAGCQSEFERRVNRGARETL